MSTTQFGLITPMLSTNSSILVPTMTPSYIQQISHFEGVPIFLTSNGMPVSFRRSTEMKVNWATQPGTVQRIDTSRHFHIFVGDLSPEVDNKALKDAFSPFGDISDAKVIRDMQTIKSKGYGFVSYLRKEDAERAIEQMNGQWLGRRTIRTNWATRKPQEYFFKENNYEETYSMAGPNNSSVYVGNIPSTTSEDDMRRSFGRFGAILEVRIFKQQGYSFVRFENKESATNAICSMNGSDINGQAIRCSWGKAGQDGESFGGKNQFGGYGYGYGGSAGQQHLGGQMQGGFGGTQQQYWQYYQQYYHSPQLIQQWQNYWQQNQGGQ